MVGEGHPGATGCGVITVTSEFVVRLWSPAAERIFGYEAGEAVGRHFTDLLPAALGDDRTGRIVVLRSRGTWRGIAHLEGRHGLVTVEVVVCAIRSRRGGIEGFVSAQCPIEPSSQIARNGDFGPAGNFSQIANGTFRAEEQVTRPGTWHGVRADGTYRAVTTVKSLDPIAVNIRAVRLAADLTQEELGERIGVSRIRVNHWENGRHEPSREHLTAICELFGRTLGWFYDPHDDEDER